MKLTYEFIVDFEPNIGVKIAHKAAVDAHVSSSGAAVAAGKAPPAPPTMPDVAGLRDDQIDVVVYQGLVSTDDAGKRRAISKSREVHRWPKVEINHRIAIGHDLGDGNQ